MKLPVEVLREEFQRAVNKSHLGLAVSLTEQCNFRCTYCYESFQLNAMSHETYAGLMAFAGAALPKLKTFTLSWFGGEPLLEWKRMAHFSRHCVTLCERYGVQMADATVPTNAWGLTPEVLGVLTESGVRTFMVSLDGQQSDHDKTRKLISGRGTFDRVYRNLLQIRQTKTQFKLILRLHLHQDNIDSQFALVEQLKRDFADDERFTLLPIAVGNFGGETVKTLRLLRVEAREIALELSRQFRADLNDEDELANRAQVCYASKPNHIFVRPDGRLAKCTSALDRPDNDVGKLLPDGRLELNERMALAWSFGFRTGESRDLACPFFTKSQEQPIQLFLKAGEMIKAVTLMPSH